MLYVCICVSICVCIEGNAIFSVLSVGGLFWFFKINFPKPLSELQVEVMTSDKQVAHSRGKHCHRFIALMFCCLAGEKIKMLELRSILPQIVFLLTCAAGSVQSVNMYEKFFKCAFYWSESMRHCQAMNYNQTQNILEYVATQD